MLAPENINPEPESISIILNPEPLDTSAADAGALKSRLHRILTEDLALDHAITCRDPNYAADMDAAGCRNKGGSNCPPMVVIINIKPFFSVHAGKKSTEINDARLEACLWIFAALRRQLSSHLRPKQTTTRSFTQTGVWHLPKATRMLQNQRTP